MIQLQNYINSDASLQRRDLSRLRKNFLFLPNRKFIKSVSHCRPIYQAEDNSKNQSEAINKTRSKYEQLMKMIREPIRLEMKYPRYSPEKQKTEVANFIQFKSHWKPRLGSELNIEKYLAKSYSQEEIQDRCEISRTVEPVRITEEKLHKNSRKYSTKTEAEQQKSTISYVKPKTTILKRILDAKHLKHVRQLLNSRIQGNNSVLENQNQNAFQLKCSYQALQRLRRQYEQKSTKAQKKTKLGKLHKLSNSNANSGQNIAGWTIKQFTD